MKHITLKKINMKKHLVLTEKWVQEVIANNPSIIGIGNVILKDKERIHRGAGRLDLLLQDEEGHGRYEVEIQLGATDESHIIRTIEYWDIERKKYPQYDHTAVIIAEDITSRFLNVISLFNGHIPLIAIQVAAIETSDGVGLFFTKVLDTVKFGYVDEDEVTSDPTDRKYWEKKVSSDLLNIADKIYDIVKTIIPEAEFNYNKHYIGFIINGKVNNFTTLGFRKKALRLEIRVQKNEEIEELISNSNINLLDYDNRWGLYKFNINNNDLLENKDLLYEIISRSYNERK